MKQQNIEQHRIEQYKFGKTASLLIAVVCLLLSQSSIVQAAAGEVYSAELNATYRHPVSGTIEDAGGEAGEAIGQGMVEGVVTGKGLLEEDAAGNLYLTLRLALTDSIQNFSFVVQTASASSWSNTECTKVGSDEANHTADYRLLMPAKDGVIKISAYVEPMGRNVIFYVQPKNLTSGNSTVFSPQDNTTSGTGQDTDRASAILEEETGLLTSSTQTTAATQQNNAAQDITSLIAQDAAGQGAVEATANTDTAGEVTTITETDNMVTNQALADGQEYVVMEDETFLAVNKQFWLNLYLEMVAAMVTAGLLLMGIKVLVEKFLHTRRVLAMDQDSAVYEEESDLENGYVS